VLLISNTRLFHLLSCTKQIIKPVFTLGKLERLKSRKLLEQLFRDGSTLLNHPVKLFYTSKALPEGIKLQAGFGVSSRTFKKAVDRNRIKRLLREAYRLQKKPLQESLEASGARLAVFFLYIGKELPDFNLIKDKMNAVLQSLEKQLARRPGSSNDVK
jgi:ribonuclease P protein component